MEKILAIDYGRRRIGLAKNDVLGFSAHGLPTLSVRNQENAIIQVLDVIQKEQPDRIVVGLPRNLDGSKSEMAKVVEVFVEQLQDRMSLPIVKIDERLTSVSAFKIMRDMGIKQKGNKGTVDKMAAVYLLEIYLQQQATRISD
jgi:putative Holliday junction resolvase